MTFAHSKLPEDIQDFICNLVTAGFMSRSEIIEATCESFHGDYNAMWLRSNTIELVDDALSCHYLEQHNWNHETDCEHLDDAFVELESIGIVARQNFSCCQSCGHNEIADELMEASNHRIVRGYVFYHEQDAEAVAHCGILYLAYGSLLGDEETSLTLANTIVEVLRQHKLDVSWAGATDKRICIEHLNWQRRRVTEVFA